MHRTDEKSGSLFSYVDLEESKLSLEDWHYLEKAIVAHDGQSNTTDLMKNKRKQSHICSHIDGSATGSREKSCSVVWMGCS